MRNAKNISLEIITNERPPPTRQKKTLNETHRFALEAVAICIINGECEISITNAKAPLNRSFYSYTHFHFSFQKVFI